MQSLTNQGFTEISLKCVNIYGGYPTGGGPKDSRLNKTTIDGNHNGSVINVSGSNAHIEGFTITRGDAGVFDGGGIVISQQNPKPIKLNVEDCIITNNYAYNGGGVSYQNTNIENNLNIKNCIITNNNATHDGGGILSWSKGSYINCVVSDNQAERVGGIFAQNTIAINHCTIVNNTSNNTDFAGGVEGSAANRPTITNSIIWGNQAAQVNGAPVTYSCIEDSNYLNGEGNIVAIPMLAIDGYHVKAGSPCIDTGNLNDSTESDIDNETRPHNGAVDMGADEYIDADQDNLPDYWEYSQFGDLSQSDTSDPDEDGVNNLQEYDHGTDPSNGEDYPFQGTVFVDGAIGDDSYHGRTMLYPKATIQAGIDVTSDGETVIVRDGIEANAYKGLGNKNLDFKGKSITVRSENGASETVIDCENEGRGFYFHSGETSSSILEGFTIKNGNASGFHGGGIYIKSSNPTISKCIIKNNNALYGGGIFCYLSSPIISQCTIEDNNADLGGGIYCSNSSSIIKRCKAISGNSGAWF